MFTNSNSFSKIKLAQVAKYKLWNLWLYLSNILFVRCLLIIIFKIFINTSDLYISECLPDENINAINQKWEWEPKTNRIISKNKEGNSQFDRCISLSGPKIDENTNLLAGCSNNSCDNTRKQFLQLKNCNNSVKSDEIWGFI